ncbi:MAG: DUF4091 domain-containing protein [Opitutales bacterium]|nr:DUF4091 domain-containing protein [Opitutales bacterium]
MKFLSFVLAFLSLVPAMAEQVAWRGERVTFHFPKISMGEALHLSLGDALPLRVLYAHKVKGEGGYYNDVLLPYPVFMQDEQYLVLQADVPADARPGTYDLRINGELVDTLKVVPAVLPPPSEWHFYLDLWQHPEAVARWCRVPLWSDRHFEAMRPLMTRLAQAGQKVVTASIIEEPWDHQTWDDWHSMVRWTRHENGNWHFDYTAFDKWVAFMETCGIDRQINCYTMLPWSKNLGYYDADGNMKKMKLEPGTPLFEETWSAFLKDFVKHLDEKGWTAKTAIGLDERPDAMAKAARDVLAKAAPQLKIASAVDRASRAQDFAQDLSPVFQHCSGIDELAATRRKAGKTTTFYVCCNPEHPNTFPHSPLDEAHWLPIFAAAQNLDGFLRWAYNSWTEDPFKNTKHRARNWAAGDCFLVYPPNETTLRFEALRDGIEDYEKIRLLRERLSAADRAKLEEILKKDFTVEKGLKGDCGKALSELVEEIGRLSE